MSRTRFILPTIFWILSVLSGGTFLWMHAVERLAVIDAYQSFSSPTRAGDAPRVLFDNDGYAWLRLSRAMHETGQWRMHVIDWENAPDGRENYWSSPPAWYLLGLGHAYALVSGKPFGQALEPAAIVSQPLLLFFGAFVFSLLIAWRWNFWAAGVFVWGFVFCFQMVWAFFAGRPDHQGFQILAATGTVLCLMAGNWGVCVKPKTAVRWFLLSAFFGALGMWIGASAAVPVLVFCALAGMLAAWKQPAANPRCWLYWGGFGAALCVVFYLVEYFPRWPLRMEVNNLFYAMAWMAGAVLLWGFSQWACGRAVVRKKIYCTSILLALLVVAACVFLWGWGPRQWSGFGEPILWRMHRFIDEFQAFFPRYGAGPATWFLVRDFGIFLLLGIVLLVGATKASPSVRRQIFCGCVPALAFLGMLFWQGRWAAFAAGQWVLFVAVGGVIFPWRNIFWPRLGVGMLIVAMLATGCWELSNARKLARREWYAMPLMMDALVRDVALQVADSSPRSPVFLASPGDALQLAYFSGGKALPSFYWENLEGVARASEIYSTPDNERAHALLKQNGITHIVYFEPRNWLGEYAYCHQGPSTLKMIQQGFAFRLFKRGEVPPWLRRVPYENPYPELRRVGSVPVVYEVLP